MDNTSSPSGTGTGPLSINSAVDQLLATPAPQEPPVEAEEQSAPEQLAR